jgi:hypothetical protein
MIPPMRADDWLSSLSVLLAYCRELLADALECFSFPTQRRPSKKTLRLWDLAMGRTRATL